MKFYERILQELKNEPHSFQTVYRHAFSFGDHVAFEQNRNLVIERVTYSQYRLEVLRLAGYLREHVRPGSTVALVMPNCPLWVECFWAIFQAGCRAALLSWQLPKATLESCLKDVGCTLVLGDVDTDLCPVMRSDELQAAQATSPLDKEPEDGWGDEIILATSSTTGAPKLYVYDGDAICKQILNSEFVLKRCKDVSHFRRGVIRHLAFLPFSHVFGLTACFLWFTMFGISYVFLNDMRPETILRTCRLHKVTHVFAVPLLWDTMATQIMRGIEERGITEKAKKGMALSLKLQDIWPALGRFVAGKIFKDVRKQTLGDNISFCISGGGMLKADTLRIINAMGYPMENGYGMTEIGIACVSMRKKPSERHGISVGEPFPSLTFHLDEDGQLMVRGNSCYIAQFINGERVAKDPQDWFATGYIFETNDKGEYIFRGRVDDLVNGANGERISPDMVESQLNLGVGCCVFGMEDGELALVVELPPEAEVTRERRAEALAEIYDAIARLPMPMQPRRVLVARQPRPLSLSGKIRRRALRAGVIDGSFACENAQTLLAQDAQSAEGEMDGLLTEMAQIFAEASGSSAQVSAQSDFFQDLGGDSLSYLELLSAIETRWNITGTALSPAPLSTPAVAAQFVLRQLDAAKK